MEVRISGRHFEITNALKVYSYKKAESFNKYLNNIIDVHIILSVEKFRQCAEISVLAKKLKITEKSIETDMYAAIDKVCSRIEKTLRRHKDKIKSHRKKDNKNKNLEGTSVEFNEEGGSE
ncbi:MAG: ribosome-associated translation inhibitor RaiA [Candidatus Omnitrophota bacterium]